MNKNQKGPAYRRAGFAPILILALIAVAAAAGYFLLTPKSKYTTAPATNQYSGIQSDSDLSKAADDLDSADTKELDTELNQLNSDASAF